jgi:hypothetical protein
MQLLKGDLVKNWEMKVEEAPDILYLTVREGHKITVLDRQTGFMNGVRDIETGYRDPSGRFWLASGMFDIREFCPLDFEKAIDMIKDNANTCIGLDQKKADPKTD